VCGSFARGGAVLPEEQILRSFDPSRRTLRRMGIDTADDASMRAFARTTADDVFTMTLNAGGGGAVTNSRLASGSGAMRPVTSEIVEKTAGRVAAKEVAEEALEKGRNKLFQDVWGEGWWWA
jgi:hypothetical protein